jgi:uncharacterized Zn finger protein (UPF0148 family)
MSEFDKEAERERLREKFARDEEKRADTKRMSELLLKGATMTNRHCDACGDPIFRYDGQEFCPTCQSREAAAAETGAESPETDVDATAVETPTDERGEVEPAEPDPTVEAPEAAGSEAGVESRTGEIPPEDRTPAGPEANGQTRTEPARAPGADAAGLSDARASLVRALASHAAAAESVSDPRVAKDHLAAAREAAEALRALDGR